jgi:hypothetical protein
LSKRRRRRRLRQCPSFLRMFASGRGMLVSLLAMFVSRFRVILRLFLLAKIMMKGSLMMMMRRRMVMSGSLMMMLTGRMLRFCHGAIPPNRTCKTDVRLLAWLLTALSDESVTTPFPRSFWRLPQLGPSHFARLETKRHVSCVNLALSRANVALSVCQGRPPGTVGTVPGCHECRRRVQDCLM